MDGIGIYHSWPIVIVGLAQLAYYIAIACNVTGFVTFPNTTMIALTATNAGLALAAFGWSAYCIWEYSDRIKKGKKKRVKNADLAKAYSDISFALLYLLVAVVEVIIVCIAAARYSGPADAAVGLFVLALAGARAANLEV